MIDLDALIALEERAREEIPFALKYKDLLLELKAAREVVEAARILLERQCIQKYREELKDALKKLEGDNEQG